MTCIEIARTKSTCLKCYIQRQETLTTWAYVISNKMIPCPVLFITTELDSKYRSLAWNGGEKKNLKREKKPSKNMAKLQTITRGLQLRLLHRYNITGGQLSWRVLVLWFTLSGTGKSAMLLQNALICTSVFFYTSFLSSSTYFWSYYCVQHWQLKARHSCTAKILQITIPDRL